MTTTLGGATLGNCEIGRVVIDNPPRNRMMIEITIASAGRWRNFENMLLSESGRVRTRNVPYSAWYFRCEATCSEGRSSYSTVSPS